jgi:hypothetical protein
MSLFCKLSRRHYWCTPHRSADHRLVQVCYECGAERPARELHDDFAFERFSHSLSSARAEVKKLSPPRAIEGSSTPSATQERIAVGQGRARKFLLVK